MIATDRNLNGLRNAGKSRSGATAAAAGHQAGNGQKRSSARCGKIDERRVRSELDADTVGEEAQVGHIRAEVQGCDDFILDRSQSAQVNDRRIGDQSGLRPVKAGGSVEVRASKGGAACGKRRETVEQRAALGIVAKAPLAAHIGAGTVVAGRYRSP